MCIFSVPSVCLSVCSTEVLLKLDSLSGACAGMFALHMLGSISPTKNHKGISVRQIILSYFHIGLKG